MIARHPPISNLSLIGLDQTETVILQMRATGASYRAISRATGVAPRKVWDKETSALRKVVRYMEQQAFLGVP